MIATAIMVNGRWAAAIKLGDKVIWSGGDYGTEGEAIAGARKKLAEGVKAP